MTIDFTWEKKHRCSTTSPEIKLAGVPAEAKKLSVTMVDFDARGYDHGGGEVAYTGQAAIAEGALRNYRGPCPPSFYHDYGITVVARDAEGKELARASAVRDFPPGVKKK
ncbi:MAG: hypothetical protein HYU77_07300 [Betaproteobacteria bacterium]|nr:hypothetical protein [Betaproteobacteria bacterium]